MTHRQFLELTDDQQYEVVRSKGVVVGEADEGTFQYIVFQVDRFYLEGKLNSSGEVQTIHSFSDTSGLVRYLGQINLPAV